MKTNKKTFISALLILTVAISFGFKTNSVNAPNGQLIVAIASEDVDCNGLTVSKDVGYEYTGWSQGEDRESVISALRAKSARDNGVDLSRVRYTTSYSTYGVIIRYENKVSSWGCTVYRYAIGFGNTSSEAHSNAIRSKDSQSPGAKWSSVAEFNQ